MAEFYLSDNYSHTHEIVVKKSRFIAHISSTSTVELARDTINNIKSSMPDARHHCTAYIIKELETPTMHSSDDGEPSGTAGRPMLDVLTGLKLANITAIVTRYFGGTLLGTGGLVRAYSDAVKEALENTVVHTHIQTPVYTVTLPHADAGKYITHLSHETTPDISYIDAGVVLRIPTLHKERLETMIAQLSAGTITVEDCGKTTIKEPYGKITEGKIVPFSSSVAQ
ncbi:MAG: YigZ family protein [Actinomycetaceae bacterium]|nr:YigZ family protein [Actinomycetaceae bacterium]